MHRVWPRYQESFGIRSQWDGSLATAQTCEFDYGDTVSGKIEIQSATSSWGVGYLRMRTSSGASCTVGSPSHDPEFMVGVK